MGDTAAHRARRYRQHKQGDHSLCVAGRCEALGGTQKSEAGTVRPVAGIASISGVPAPPAEVPADGERVPGGIETAVIAFVESLRYVEPDPRALLAQIAVRLAQRVDETGALPAAVRELRVLLVQLTEVPNGPSGVVDETRLRRAQRRLDSVLATAG